MKNKTTLITILIAVIALGAGFGGGFAFKNYQISKTRSNFAGGQFQRGGMMARGTQARGMGGATVGTILSMDDKSITVKMMDGSTKIVLFADSTTYSNTLKASKTDLKVGSDVAVFGTSNSDGSVTATNVQINPMFGRPQASPSPVSNK